MLLKILSEPYRFHLLGTKLSLYFQNDTGCRLRLLKPLSIVMCAEGTLLQNKKLLKSVRNVYISAIFAQYCEHGRNISNISVIQFGVMECTYVVYCVTKKF